MHHINPHRLGGHLPQAGQPLADGLKNPSTPVYLLHGGDHFTTLFRVNPAAAGEDAAAAAGVAADAAGEGAVGEGEGEDEGGEPAPVTWYHYNGLPPGGPRMATLEITAKGGVAGPAPKTQQDHFIKPVPGEIDDIVQAHPDDKKDRPDEWNTWRFEAVLAIDDPDVQGAAPPADYKPPLFTNRLAEFAPGTGSAWRCRSCYANRFSTFCFGINEPSSTTCEHCNKVPTVEDQGWSIWLTYDELPGGYKRLVTNRHGPKALVLLQGKWPGSVVKSLDDAKLPSV